MSNASNPVVDLLPNPIESPATTFAGVALFAGVFLLFMGFKECSGRSSHEMDSGIKKIGLGIVAALVGAGLLVYAAATFAFGIIDRRQLRGLLRRNPSIDSA